MSVHLKPLNEQVMVITGASSGIGLATALAAAREGVRVVLCARSEHTLQAVAQQLEGEGFAAHAVVADVGSREEMARVAQAAIKRFRRIDTWVNNAGLSIYGRLDEVDEEDSRRLFDTNFWGVVNGSLVALPHLRERGGALINVGSEVSDAIVPLQGMYAASKHAVKGFTDALRVELEADNAPVSVTLVQPTAVDTPFPEHARNYLSQEPKLPTPMIDPEKVAAAILAAATKPDRDVKVGTMATLNSAMARLMPSIGDRFAQKQIGRQQRDEPPRDRAGTLFQPGERVGTSGRTHGRNNQNAADPRAARESNVRPARP